MRRSVEKESDELWPCLQFSTLSLKKLQTTPLLQPATRGQLRWFCFTLLNILEFITIRVLTYCWLFIAPRPGRCHVSELVQSEWSTHSGDKHVFTLCFQQISSSLLATERSWANKTRRREINERPQRLNPTRITQFDNLQNKTTMFSLQTTEFKFIHCTNIQLASYDYTGEEKQKLASLSTGVWWETWTF